MYNKIKKNLIPLIVVGSSIVASLGAALGVHFAKGPRYDLSEEIGIAKCYFRDYGEKSINDNMELYSFSETNGNEAYSFTYNNTLDVFRIVGLGVFENHMKAVTMIFEWGKAEDSALVGEVLNTSLESVYEVGQLVKDTGNFWEGQLCGGYLFERNTVVVRNNLASVGLYESNTNYDLGKIFSRAINYAYEITLASESKSSFLYGIRSYY